jgi:capsid assembly protease
MDGLTARISTLTRSPLWAISPEAQAVLVHNLLTWTDPRLQVNPFSKLFADIEAAKPALRGPKASRVMVMPIKGVLTKDDNWYGTTYEAINDAVDQAASDPSISRLVLAVDSPGGEVTGLPEAAASLAALAKVKPVSAMVDGMSASAAYWLTSQASDITIAPSASLGSVGARIMHVELHAGEFKTEWSTFQPLSEAAQEDMQQKLDSVHKDFISAIAYGRGAKATQDITAARYGEGRMFHAKTALGHGLADKVQSPRDFYRALTPAEEIATELPYYGLQRARLEMERHK